MCDIRHAAHDLTALVRRGCPTLPQSLKNPYEITSGPDGALWFTQYQTRMS